MPIAFFDLDRTLVAVNSATLWVLRAWRRGQLRRRRLVEAAGWLLLYRAGVGRLDAALHRAVADLEGQEETALREDTRRFWAEVVAPALRPGARRALERHRRRGDLLVLLTSSSVYLAEAAVEELGLDGAVCTRFEVEDGHFTGRIAELCFGPGKLELARRWARERGERLEDAAFYTDSAADLPVLEAVAEPVCVSPDPRLRALARKRGWRVEDWGRPGGFRRPAGRPAPRAGAGA